MSTQPSSKYGIIPRTITVLLGGTSAEREISLMTGVAVARALRSLGHTVLEVDPRAEDWTVPAGTEVVFLALHGTYGEDGTVQRRLDDQNLAYTGCGPECSALAFDKVQTKQRFMEKNVPTPRFSIVEPGAATLPEGWDPPVILKPSCQGSSVGLEIVRHADQWQEAVKRAAAFDSTILMEEFIEGRELTVGILDGQTLPLVEVRPKSGAYDYHNKYTAGATDYLVPAPLDASMTTTIQQTAARAFEAVGGRDYGRIDIMLSTDNHPFVLEINTLPGMTETSLLPKAAAAAGVDYAGLCQAMVDLALQRAPHPAV